MDFDYDVVTKDSTSWHDILKNALPGTAMSEVYRSKMEGKPGALVNTPGVKTGDAAINNEKTLMFASSLGALSDGRFRTLRIQGYIRPSNHNTFNTAPH